MSFCAKNIQHNEQPITYEEALARIAKLASTPIANHDNYTRTVPTAFPDGYIEVDADRKRVILSEAVGHQSLRTLCAPHSTPRTDTSAMDGFAVNAETTGRASADSPLRLRVIDSIVAGDDASRIAVHSDAASNNVCVEIMTGACFPEQKLPHLDSVVKIEDVVFREGCSEDGISALRYIELSKPVRALQHRRPAGSDFSKGDIIIERETIFEPKHIAALASLGYTHVEISISISISQHEEKVRSATVNSEIPLRVGILSTGSEIVEMLKKLKGSYQQNLKQNIPDSNGPYLVSSLKLAFPSIAVDYLGVVRDDEEELAMCLRKAIFEDDFDVIVTSGGVSKGRHDLVRYVIETRLEGRVVFHGVKIRPGAPVLLASFDHPSGTRSKARPRQAAVFGAPGNPLATAIALRFFVMPYVFMASYLDVRQVMSQYTKAIVWSEKSEDEDTSTISRSLCRKPRDATVFKLARRRAGSESHVHFVEDQASYKLRGLLEADCWAVVPAGMSEVVCGDTLALSPL